ncbi:hypothetical protein [Rhodovulum steppense]|uniref:Uncharacterized protein n=1 Tax=Rhodovulum steppense TaxID=540251 RepID=A0A4R1Z1M1_9RHOB|nr:hypothetical protein [Rhodovulum steppense]TCM87093.1 hypothetical protein EV216_103171 [Rhodovulum steppense]
MTSIPCTAAPVVWTTPDPDALVPRWSRLSGHLRNMLFAACLSLSATMILHAEEAPQDWVPDVLDFPEDIEVLTDRAIGSTLRMFSFSTEQDAEALMVAWEEALRVAGYTIIQTQGEMLDATIEFSGQDIGNAKIVLTPTAGDERAVIEFDATLR